MNPTDYTIADLALHKLIKEPHGPASIALRDSALPITESAQRLVDQLYQHYHTRPGKGYGRFEEDELSFPMPRLIREHVLDQTLNFADLSVVMMQHLAECAGQEPLACGAYVLIARIRLAPSDCILVALISEAIGTAIDPQLNILDSMHLDLGNLRAAGRIDLMAWQNGAERYISFLKGRSDVAQYFKQFLGCNDVVIALKETQKLVQSLNDFAEAQGMEGAQRDQMLERAHGYLDELGGHGAPINLDRIAEHVWPEAPERLQSVLHDESKELSSGFVPDRRAIRPLVRYKANGPQWKLEFDRSSLRSGAVIYDKRNDTLVLSNVPEHLKRLLQEGDAY